MAATPTDPLIDRLRNQRLSRPEPRDAEEIVSWFGAIQAQDFPGAKWAIGLRAKGLTDAAVEGAFERGRILRTHVLRPTWHFVTAADIRWLLALTGARIVSRMASRHRQLELDSATVTKSHAAVTRALERASLTRREIAAVLQRARVVVTPERLSHLLMLAEVDGLVCSGPLRDRQFTYALMDDRAPAARPIPRDLALAQLAERYFRSHGPATVADFAWWSGLPIGEARSAVHLAGLSRNGLVRQAVLSVGSRPRASASRVSAWLLPNFDEYLVAYKDRQAILGDSVHPRDALNQTVILDGRAAGTWRARRASEAVAIEIVPRVRLTPDARDRIRRAARRYGAFIGRPAVLAHTVKAT